MQSLTSRSGIGSADASKSPSTPSRFRKSGFAVALGAAAVLAAAPLKTANAAIVYTSAVNATVYSATDSKYGPSTANISVAGVPLFTLFNNNDNKSPPTISFNLTNLGLTTKVNVTGVTTDGFQLAAKYAMLAATKSSPAGPPSVSIGSTSLFSASGPVYLNYYYGPSNSSTAENYYIGFQFNPTGSQVNYGWAHFTTTAIGFSFTLADYAYDNTGASIITAQTVAVPEPASMGLIVLGGIGLLARRRRHGTTGTA